MGIYLFFFLFFFVFPFVFLFFFLHIFDMSMVFIFLWFCRFDASDGKMKIKAIFSSRLSSEILSGNIQNLCLIQVLDYTVNEIPSKSEK